MARTSRSASNGPTPAAWLRTRLTCSSPSRSTGIAMSESLPKPVVTPYAGVLRVTRSSTIRRVARARSRASGASFTVASPVATAKTSSMRSEAPSITTGDMA